MEATALTTSGAAPAVSTADQARIAAALEASQRREHHPRLPFRLGRVAALGSRARPSDHARRGRLPSPPTSRTAPSRAPAVSHRAHGARRDQRSAPPVRRR